MRTSVKVALAFLAGVAFATGVFFWTVRPRYENHVFDHGFHDGYFCGQEDVFEQIAAEFGWEHDAGHRALFKVGRGEAVVVDQNGVKTLRITFPKDLTKRCSQPLAVPMTSFYMTSAFNFTAKLALASGG